MPLTFRGGIRLAGMNASAASHLETLPAPERVTLVFTSGAGQRAVCAEGDRVLRGQTVVAADVDHAPLHAPFSGTVTKIEKDRIEIENDQKSELSPECRPFETPISEAEPEALLARIREAGITNLGRDEIPLAKTLAAAGTELRRILIPALESEPGIAAPCRLLDEKTREIVNGAKVLLRVTGARRAVFVLDEANEGVAAKIVKICGASRAFAAVLVKPKYPQDMDRPLTRAVLGSRFKRGADPRSAGCLVVSAEAVLAVYTAFAEGLPVTERILSVTGDCVERPRQLRVPLGTSFDAVLRFCGGLTKKPLAVLDGGAMAGARAESLSAPVKKDTRAVTALRDGAAPSVPSPCVKCGRCVKVCPERLYPLYIARAADRGAWRSAKGWEPEACIGCGACAYVCPAGIPLVEKIRLAQHPPKKGDE